MMCEKSAESGQELFEGTGIRRQVIDEICAIAEECKICRVLLFGSRARGDYKERSDIDLAAAGGHIDEFSIRVDEETSTLLSYDVVNLDGAVDSELRESIRREGRVIYEKV